MNRGGMVIVSNRWAWPLKLLVIVSSFNVCNKSAIMSAITIPAVTVAGRIQALVLHLGSQDYRIAVTV
eukprot:1635952-Amphidinium_carterae.1